MENYNETPQVIEMEKFVLGAMLLKDGAVIPKVSAIIDADDFYRPEHRLIFAAIMTLYRNGIIPNVLSLAQYLRETKDLNRITLTYVLGIVEIAHTTAYAETYARTIKDQSDLRKYLRLADEIKAAALNQVPPADINYFVAHQLNFLARPETSKIVKASDYFAKQYDADLSAQLAYSKRTTGFQNIDAVQIFGAGLYVLGGNPAAGKTTFCWQLAEQLAERGVPCIFCSYEMTQLELQSKTLARRLFLRENQNGIENSYEMYSAAELRRGLHHAVIDELKEKFRSQNLPLYVISLQDETIDDLLKTIRPLCINVADAEDFNAPIVFIDYLQIIRPTQANLTTKAGVDEIVRRLKLFQRETNTTFIVVSSFNRANYLSPVFFESFKESGGIEYTADVVWGLQAYSAKDYSPSKIAKSRLMEDAAKRQQPREIQLKCLKNRQGNNYDCFFKYFSRHDYFQPCSETDFGGYADTITVL